MHEVGPSTCSLPLLHLCSAMAQPQGSPQEAEQWRPADPGWSVPETVSYINRSPSGVVGKPEILALGRQSQENQEFKIIFGSVGLCG